MLLDLIAQTLPKGFGYSNDPEVSMLQVKLSVMLQALHGTHTDNLDPRSSTPS